MTARDNFLKTLTQTYPTLSHAESRVAPNLICPSVIELPVVILQQAQAFGQALFRLRENPSYKNYLLTHVHPTLADLGLQETQQHSICMSYDFHIDHDGVLKLIEVNTNAAFLALSDLLYKSWNLPTPVENFKLSEIVENLRTEMKLSGVKRGLNSLAIVDNSPETQRLFIEFLVFQEFFKSQGLICKILDVKMDSSKFDFVYNRGTDFYWQSSEWSSLKKRYNERQQCISPQPGEYFYMADKSRMVDWCRSENLTSWGVEENDIQTLKKHLPEAFDLTPASAEELWSRRKTLFFKPQQSFGSKQSYKGSSISRRVFDEIKEHKFLAQSFVPAPEVQLQTPEGPQGFKYDLRFFAYQERIQSVIARVYQGQVTNLQSPYGGFAPIRWQK